MAILSIPRHLAFSTEGILAFPGQGEVQRIINAVALWEQSQAAQRLLVAGQNYKLERTVQVLDINVLQQPPYHLKRTKGVVVEQFATHTGDQALWALDMVRTHGLSSLTLAVPGYHMVKAYLSVLKKFLDGGCRIPIIPAPTIMPPDHYVPEVQVNTWAMVPGEVERLIQYQKDGFATSIEELFDYLNWLYQDPFVKKLCC